MTRKPVVLVTGASEEMGHGLRRRRPGLWRLRPNASLHRDPGTARNLGEMSRPYEWQSGCSDGANEGQVDLTEGLMRVLLATDGSDDAKAAAAFLEQLPLTERSHVRIVSVTERRPTPIDFPGVQAYDDAVAAEGQRVVDEACASLSVRAATETARRYVGI